MPAGATAFYYVEAIDENGNQSTASRIFSGTPSADP